MDLFPDKTGVADTEKPVVIIATCMETNTENEQAISGHRLCFPVRQFLSMFLPVVAVILIIAFAFTNMRINAQLEQITATERTNLNQLSGYMAAEASTSLHHLLALSQEAALIRTMDSPFPGAMQSIFMTMAKRNPNYQQIRWIDETGNERARITRNQDRLFAVDNTNLQDKSSKYYFNAARSLLMGEVYISRLDLNMENGQIEIPIRPTLRVATPVQDGQGRRRGILIINISMKYMLAAIRYARERNPETDYFLVNKDGNWLTAPSQQAPAEPQLDPDIKFSQKYPIAWKHISTSSTGTIELGDAFWVWETLAPKETIRHVAFADSGRGVEIPVIHSNELSLKLLAHKPIRSSTELRQDTLVAIMLGAALLLAAYAWGLLFFLRGQQMEKQAEVNIAQSMVRAKQMERLKELEERFRLLVEASSIGMVVVDADGFITMSNPAAESMLGYDKGGLDGLSADSLLPTSQRDLHARMRTEFLLNPEVRTMGKGRKLEALTADGRKIPVEVGLNPFLDHGNQVVLASIIDLR
jgi:PAS domain S-box-containing protein